MMASALKGRLSRGALVVALCILAACGGGSSGDSSSSSACSEVGFSNRVKIADGTLCRSEETSSSSVARLDVYSVGGGWFICTGTVISPNAVLTAAHCVTVQDEETGEVDGSWVASVGISLIVDGEERVQNVPPENVVIHPNFILDVNQALYFKDVAIIKTVEPLPVASVPLLTSRAPQIDEPAVVAGYGQVEHEGPPQLELSAGEATVSQVTENHIFVDYLKGESHPCQGDSGSALLLREGGELVIAGVVSQSAPGTTYEHFCRVGDSTLYTNLQEADTLSFILNVVPDAQLR